MLPELVDLFCFDFVFRFCNLISVSFGDVGPNSVNCVGSWIFIVAPNLLHLSPRLINLPEEVKKELKDPDSRYVKRLFLCKPSIMYTKDRQGSSSKVPIILWIKYMPKHELAELEVAFKAMGKLIPEVGLMVAFHCDSYVSKAIKCVNMKALNKYFFVLSVIKGALLLKISKTCLLGVVGIQTVVHLQA